MVTGGLSAGGSGAEDDLVGRRVVVRHRLAEHRSDRDLHRRGGSRGWLGGQRDLDRARLARAKRLELACEGVAADLHSDLDPGLVVFAGVRHVDVDLLGIAGNRGRGDRKSTRLNSSHTVISYAVFCLKKKKKKYNLLNMKIKSI